MRFDPASLPYLNGEKFSNNHVTSYDYLEPIPDRIKFLCSLINGKSVLHLGCLDHQNLIEEKYRRKQWLHSELTESASRCLGVDVDQQAAEFVKNKLGFDNIILHDFTSDNNFSGSNEQWEYAILGELLEHVDNPVQFLESIRKNLRGNTKYLVITVPNAWTRTTMRYANRSEEIINSDHRYWFTPYTLAKVIIRAGFQLDAIHFANRVPLNGFELIKKKVSNFLGKEPSYPFTYASSIIGIAKF